MTAGTGAGVKGVGVGVGAGWLPTITVSVCFVLPPGPRASIS